MVRRRLVVSLTALALIVTGLVGSAGPAAPTPAEPAPAAFAAAVDDVPVDLRPAPGNPSAGPESAVARLVGGDDAVEPFTMIGATYGSSATRPGQVRALVGGEWTRWFALQETEVAADHGPDAGGGEGDRPASDPIWIGAGEGFELRLPADAHDVTVHLVRETEVAGGAPESSPPAEASEAGGGAESGYQMPAVRPRSAWGAGPYHGTVAVADGLERAVVHHTVNGNGYSAGQVPSMLRSIQAYHQGSRGWDDIGYNFVIDRFGTIWEARKNSLYQPVIGAHARDHNEGSVGVAYLGDGTSTGLSSTAVTNLGRFLGWKLRLHGSRPMTSNIVGHRNVGQTSCPGNTVYAQLGGIRSRAIALQPPAGPFFDVPNGHAQAPVLTWGRNASVVEQLRDGTFHPERNMTRADSVYWLWRFAGRPPASTPHGFTDIPANAYYRNAVRWARQKGIVRASSDDRFHPMATTTRERDVLQLWRYAGHPNPSVDHGYRDVPDGAPSEVALDWADAYGLVRTTTFGRGAHVRRGEGVLLLYRLRRFDDVPVHHFAYPAITWARRHVIAKGYAHNEFRPGDDVTRGQGLVWIWRMMDRPDQPTPPEDPFTDDTEGSWYDAALDWAADAEWVEGNGGSPTSFAPDGVLNRGDAVTWAWNIAGRPASANEHEFSDVPPAFDDAVDWADAFGIVSGFADDTYRPGNPVTRAQFLRMLNQLANRPGAWAVTPPTTVEF